MVQNYFVKKGGYFGLMTEEEIIDILQNIICDEVIGTYCVEIQKQGVKCDENCKDDDCYLVKAIERNIRFI